MSVRRTGRSRDPGMPGADAGRRTYTVEEAAKLLGLGRNACYDGVKSGQIPSLRVGKRLLIPRPALDKLLGG